MYDSTQASLDGIMWELRKARWDAMDNRKRKVKKVYRDRYIDMDKMLRDCQKELAAGIQEAMK